MRTGCWKRSLTVLLTATLSGLASPAAAAESDAPFSWTGVERVVVIGDVHGYYDTLVELLTGLGMVDGDLAWTGGEQHLVFVGDLIDRGPGDRAIMDLVRRLQDEAPANGGYVHLVLGNHEIMNLTGDLRYVSPESFAEFAADETARERDAGWNAYHSRHQQSPSVRAAFEEACPPGFFARQRAFKPDGEYGKWLLNTPTVVRVNEVLFVHGGLLKSVAKLGLEGINTAVREEILEWLKKRRPTDKFEKLAFAPGGPVWFRGYSLEHERTVRAELKEVLNALDARALVVAHTPTNMETITSRFNQRVFRVDIGMGYGADPKALVLVDGKPWVFDPKTLARTTPMEEAPQGQGWSAMQEELDDMQMADFLAKAKVGEIAEWQHRGRHIKLVELKRRGLHLRTLFQFVDETTAAGAMGAKWNPRRYRHEVAAYRVDRLIDLGMVPVSVLRKIKRQEGAISYWTRASIDLTYIREHDRLDLLQGLDKEIADARTFTVLIGARRRDDAAKMLIPPERKIVLADNSKAFSLETEIADEMILEDSGLSFNLCDMSMGLRMALEELDRSVLQEQLLDYLSADQIDAMLVRRDRILETCAGER